MGAADLENLCRACNAIVYSPAALLDPTQLLGAKWLRSISHLMRGTSNSSSTYVIYILTMGPKKLYCICRPNYGAMQSTSKACRRSRTSLTIAPASPAELKAVCLQMNPDVDLGLTAGG